MTDPILIAGAAAGAALAGVALKYAADARAPFLPTRWVWSRGLGLCCDKNGGVDYVKRQRGGERVTARFDPAAYAEIQSGDLVWVRSIALPQFIEQVLPSVRNRFGLVTGDEDWSMPSGFDGSGTLLDNELVVRWFAQNYDGTDTSGKMSGIPIGLDFHTISNRLKWGQWPASPQKQERSLEEIVAQMPTFDERHPRVHADFHFNRHRTPAWGEDRRDVEAALRKNALVDFQERRVPRHVLWKTKAKYGFVVSPHGNGLDCHRTWESLVLGNIVIVPRSPLDPLYDGLPVAIVDSWDEITPYALARWREELAPLLQSADARRKLTNDYWIAHMRSRLGAAL